MFQEWLEKCPIEYDEHLQTSDDDITSINFHYKNIWNRKKKGKNEILSKPILLSTR